MLKSTLIASALTFFVMAGCQNSEPTAKTASAVSPGMVNSTCPMSGKALKEGCPTTTWDGETIGFCGPGCKASFDGQTPAEKDAEVAEMKNAG